MIGQQLRWECMRAKYNDRMASVGRKCLTLFIQYRDQFNIEIINCVWKSKDNGSSIYTPKILYALHERLGWFEWNRSTECFKVGSLEFGSLSSYIQ
jgi:hypothetical protein